MFAGRFGRVFGFCRFCAKVSRTEKVDRVAESDPHNQLQCKVRALGVGKGGNVLKHSQLIKIVNFPWFLGVLIFDDGPNKNW